MSLPCKDMYDPGVLQTLACHKMRLMAKWPPNKAHRHLKSPQVRFTALPSVLIEECAHFLPSKCSKKENLGKKKHTLEL